MKNNKKRAQSSGHESLVTPPHDKCDKKAKRQRRPMSRLKTRKAEMKHSHITGPLHKANTGKNTSERRPKIFV